MFFRTIAMFALLSIVASATLAEDQTVGVEIDFLINAVSESGCKFVRNGKEHTADEAVDHLQMKARRGKRYYDTTEEFIDRIASKSSWSGKQYLIQCDGEPAVTAAEWFTQVLVELRASTQEAIESD